LSERSERGSTSLNNKGGKKRRIKESYFQRRRGQKLIPSGNGIKAIIEGDWATFQCTKSFKGKTGDTRGFKTMKKQPCEWVETRAQQKKEKGFKSTGWDKTKLDHLSTALERKVASGLER